MVGPCQFLVKVEPQVLVHDLPFVACCWGAEGLSRSCDLDLFPLFILVLREVHQLRLGGVEAHPHFPAELYVDFQLPPEAVLRGGEQGCVIHEN